MTEFGNGFFERHSEKFLEMAFDNQRSERVENPDGYGFRKGDCGDSVAFYLTMKNSNLEFVSYDVNGCVNTNACAATISRLTEGKSIDEAWDLTPEKIVDFLETLPEHEMHCAELTAGAFFLALKDFQNKQNK